jgi:hypothetical protein
VREIVLDGVERISLVFTELDPQQYLGVVRGGLEVARD